GVREKLEQGWLPGKPPLGYMTVGEHGRKIHVLHPDKAPLMREAFELYASGNHSVKSLNILLSNKGLRTSFNRSLAKSQLHKLLSNPFYIGKIRWKGRLYDGKQEPLISIDLFEQVQQRLTKKTPPKYNKHN